MDQYSRIRLLMGESFSKVAQACVAVIGCGGVGSFAIESLARSGVKKLIIVDKDVVDVTNINRQIMALHSNVGEDKVSVMAKRIALINPECEVVALPMLYNEMSASKVYKHNPDFVIDACDTLSNKVHIIKTCLEKSIPFISSMGAANKCDPTKVSYTTLDKTYNCKLSKIMRQMVKKIGLQGNKIPVVFSSELPTINGERVSLSDGNQRKAMPYLGSSVFVPSTIGIACASYCIQAISQAKNNI